MAPPLCIGKSFELRAAEVGNQEVANLLLDHDADIDAVNFAA